MHPRKQQILDILGSEPEDMDELAQGVIKIIENCPNVAYHHSFKEKTSKKFKVVGFKWDVSWHPLVSNSHCCPLDGVTNWSGHLPGAPDGYPGFIGRVWIRYRDYTHRFGHDPFSGTLTYTGTGGAGSYDGPWDEISAVRFRRYGYNRSKNQYPEIHCYSWDYRFYQADWPGIAGVINSERIISGLRVESFNMRHIFEWNDPETQIADKAFIAECTAINAVDK